MATGILVLCALLGQASLEPAREGSRYRLRIPDRASDSVEIEASLPASERLDMLDYGAWSQARGWATFVSGLQVREGERTLAVRPSGRRSWTVEPPPRGRLELRYRVDLGHARAPSWPDGPRTTSAWREGEAMFLLMGALLVHGADEGAVELTFELPDTWKVAAPWKEAGPGRFTVESLDRAARNVAVLGAFDEHRFSVDDQRVRIVTFDAGPAIAEPLVSITDACLRGYAELFGTGLAGDFLAVTYVDRWDTGEAYEDSFVLASKRPLAEASRALWGQTVAHELFHSWLGKRLRAAQWAEAQWFSEGVTEYMASVALLRAGWMTVEEFTDRLEKHVEFYRLHWKGPPLSGVDLVTAGREKSVNNAAIYDGGCMIALALDVEIQAATEGARGLEDLLRALLELGPGPDVEYALEDVFALASEVAGKDLHPFFLRHVLNPEALDLEGLFERAGFSLAVRAEQAHVRVAAEADAAQARIRARILHGRFDGREQERSREIDEIVHAGLPHAGPGLALTVVQNGRTVHSRGYGLADLEAGQPMRATTRVHAASVAKQFTAYSIFLLQDEGRLSIEDPLQRYLPEMTGFGGVRIRHLLEHTSGIRDQWQLLGLTGVRTDGDIVTQEDVLRLLSRQQGTGHPPGTRQSYCNSGYTLLAEIVERVSGLTFREFTARHIFRPLGMERSCFVDDAGEPFPERAASYEEEGGAFRAVPLNFATYGATGLLTTTEDLARWGVDLLAHRVVRPDLLEAMRRPGLLPDGEAMDFQNGLHAGQVAGRAIFGHPGADAGYRSAVLVVPDSDLVIALLGNFDGVDMWGLPERIATVFLGPSPASADAPAAEAEPPAPPPPSAPSGELELSAFEGTYYSSELGTAYEIAVEGDALVARHPRNGTLVLESVGPDHFACDRWFLRELRFVRDGQQRITGVEASSSRSEGSRFLRIPR